MVRRSILSVLGVLVICGLARADYTEFFCRSGGSNLNAGAASDNSEPGTSAEFTYASGSWVQSTGVFTVASGNPLSDGVEVGDWASVYADGATVTGYVGIVLARDATTITVSLTLKSGTAPTDGTSNRTVKIGGAWQGPNGAETFPINFAQYTMTSVDGANPVRVNLKNDQTYSITTTLSPTDGVDFSGYTTTAGDKGKATIDGGTSGAAYTLWSGGGSFNRCADMIFTHNGATSTADAVVGAVFLRCVVHDVLFDGFNVGVGISCEAYNCGNDGFDGGSLSCYYCISHDNTLNGFDIGTSGGNLQFCVSHNNGGRGIHVSAHRAAQIYMFCDIYDNGDDGIRIINNVIGGTIIIQNCNIFANGGYGIELGTNLDEVTFSLYNNAFGSGTMANAQGDENNADNLPQINKVVYDANETPWNDPDNGDFSLVNEAAIGAGIAEITTTAPGYGPMDSDFDRGAVQSIPTGGGGGLASPTTRSPIFSN